MKVKYLSLCLVTFSMFAYMCLPFLSKVIGSSFINYFILLIILDSNFSSDIFSAFFVAFLPCLLEHFMLMKWGSLMKHGPCFAVYMNVPSCASCVRDIFHFA